ncbi:MAG: histidine-type phosphatase [Bacteroidales bacterium]|nr:histidine-type phosphatase [Bacteroidales bacterium]
MRRLLLSLLAVLPALMLGAQTYDVLDIVRADRNKAAGNEGPYRFDAPALTPAPKGYVPFYISHYGRHGSRYAWNGETYSVIAKTLEAARASGSLTERGEKFYADYQDFQAIPVLNTGDLTDLGREQHAAIAAGMVQAFPEVFAGGGRVLARASISERVIVSMNAFTLGLLREAPRLDIEVRSLHTDMPATCPTRSALDSKVRYAGRIHVPESVDSFRARKVDVDGILDKLFSDRRFLEETGGRWRFVYELFTLWCGYHNYCEDGRFDDLFTSAQAAGLWESENYAFYAGHSAARYRHLPLLADIIDRADEAIRTGGSKADLRFGHDFVLNAFCPLLDIDGCGHEPETADEVKYWFHSYDTPMASTLLFILYRSRKSPDILFKVLRNGAEVTLPQLNPVSGPYYRWDDFTAWSRALAAAHPARPR